MCELPSERVLHVVILFMVFLEVVGFLRNHLRAPIYGIAHVRRVQSKTADAVKHILDVRTFPPQVLLEKRLCAPSSVLSLFVLQMSVWLSWCFV